MGTHGVAVDPGLLSPALLGIGQDDAGSAGVTGEGKVNNPGVLGHSIGQAGIVGKSEENDGVQGTATISSKSGVVGFNTSGGPGVGGFSKDGAGVVGKSETDIGVLGIGGRLAGRFVGDVEITGTLSGPKRIGALFFDNLDVGGTGTVVDEKTILNPSKVSSMYLLCTTNQVGSGRQEFGITSVSFIDQNGQPQTQVLAHPRDPNDPFGSLKSSMFVERLTSVTIAGRTFDGFISGQLTMFEVNG